jgi:hypothetical protein
MIKGLAYGDPHHEKRKIQGQQRSEFVRRITHEYDHRDIPDSYGDTQHDRVYPEFSSCHGGHIHVDGIPKVEEDGSPQKVGESTK